MRFSKWVLGLTACSVPGLAGAFFNDFDRPPHDYWNRELGDPVSKWIAAQAGEATVLQQRALVEELLGEFGIPAASQVLVFTKTSLQREAVGPENPRAMYFNEEVYLGWMPGGRIEIASADPEVGLVFYYEDERPAEAETPVTFDRAKVCLQCHAGAATNFLPGPLARSVYPDEHGRARGSVTSFDLMSHRVPVAVRWGGWYVSGGEGLAHLGNQTGERTPAARPFAGHFDGDKYPVATGDALALMVFDHQIGIHKQIIESHYKVRQAEQDGEWEPVAGEEVETLVADLLFSGEAGFEPGAVQPDAGFIEGFRRNRQEDAAGRSLKDFATEQGRLFQLRCSYMIYSGSFQGLPEKFRKRIYTRLTEVLDAGSGESVSAHLPAGERAAILAVLRSTLEGFPQN